MFLEILSFLEIDPYNKIILRKFILLENTILIETAIEASSFNLYLLTMMCLIMLVVVGAIMELHGNDIELSCFRKTLILLNSFRIYITIRLISL